MIEPASLVKKPNLHIFTSEAEDEQPIVVNEAELARPNPLHTLLCPECGCLLFGEGALLDQPIPEYTVLECCRPWPVIAGIPVLNFDPLLVELIRAGKHREALLQAIRPPFESRIRPRRVVKFATALKKSRWDRKAERLLDGSPRYSDWLELFFNRSRKSVRDYFYFKFTKPKHLAALSVAATFSDGPVLDVGCGAGQITRFIAARNPVVGLDSTFWLLYLAKTFVAPRAFFVCSDAEKPLPFLSGSFGSVISTNAFHFLRSQESAWSEMCRISTGPIALISLRHLGVMNDVENHALSIDGYRALTEGSRSSCCIVSDLNIVDRYLQRLGPDFASDGDALESAPLVSLIATNEPKSFGGFEHWPHTGSGINPLYHKEGNGYRLKWPSDEYQADNPGFSYLKDYVDADLEDNFVLVDLPDRY